MASTAPMYGPDVTFTGVPRCDLADPGSYAAATAVIVGAPYDSGTSYRSGARMGPMALRTCDYSEHTGSRPHLSLRVDPLLDLGVVDAGDVLMAPTETKQALGNLQAAITRLAAAGVIPVVLGGDHTVAQADITGLAEHFGYGRISVMHFDAHADTGDIQFGSLYGHGLPMRRVIESGAVRGDRFLQIGLRGYWPEPPELLWMAEQGMRCYEMAEIDRRGLDAVLTEAMAIAVDDTDGVFLSVDIDVVDPGMAPGTGTPEPGGLTARELLDAVRRIGRDVPLVGMEIVEVAPPYDHADITAMLGNRVVLETLSGIARRRRTPSAGTRWDESTPMMAGRAPVPAPGDAVAAAARIQRAHRDAGGPATTNARSDRRTRQVRSLDRSGASEVLAASRTGRRRAGRPARRQRIARAATPSPHLLELHPCGHLLRDERGLQAVEHALEPADQLGLGDPQLAVGGNGVLGERQREPLEFLPQLRREAVLELVDRPAVDLPEPHPAGLVQRRGPHLLEQLLDHRADPHDLGRFADRVGRADRPIRSLVVAGPPACLPARHVGVAHRLAVRPDHHDPVAVVLARSRCTRLDASPADLPVDGRPQHDLADMAAVGHPAVRRTGVRHVQYRIDRPGESRPTRSSATAVRGRSATISAFDPGPVTGRRPQRGADDAAALAHQRVDVQLGAWCRPAGR